jgi:cytochrome bd-type quinol oxidase subunit 2
VDLHQFSDWLSATSFSQLIQTTSWAIPAIQTVHLISLALLFACALVFSLRIAGLGLESEPLNLLAARFTRAIWWMLLLLLLTGGLLITAEPGRTITNPVFYAKMVMLAAVVVITLWLSAVARRQFERPSGLHVLMAVVGMLLWIGIMFAGRFIAYVESY